MLIAHFGPGRPSHVSYSYLLRHSLRFTGLPQRPLSGLRSHEPSGSQIRRGWTPAFMRRRPRWVPRCSDHVLLREHLQPDTVSRKNSHFLLGGGGLLPLSGGRVSAMIRALMLELPDVVVYIETLESWILRQSLQRVRLASPFALRLVDPQVGDPARSTRQKPRRRNRG